MSVNAQVEQQVQEVKPSDKEQNFERLRKLYEQERLRAQQLESENQKLKASPQKQEEDDDYDDDEPYVDRRKFQKGLQKAKQETLQAAQSDIQKAVQQALYEERRQNWIKQNGDFYDVMKHAEKLYETDPELAETILEMPEGFERQKLVYKNIKALGLHKPPAPKSNIQETIEKNRRSPFYQPSGMGSPPYASSGDFSQSGQKNAYDKMKELQSRLRLG